jgi:GNAT superfamily N-acetyltransferase
VVCDRIEPWEHGTVVFATEMAGYWDYNLVRLEGGDPGLSAGELMDAADRLQDGLSHRCLEIDDAEAGARLRADFKAAGWASERLAWMRRPGPPPPPSLAVEEVPYAATRELRDAWHRASDWWDEDPAADRFLELEEAVAARRRSRAFTIRDAGKPVAFATLWAPPDSRAAEVEQAFTLPERRGAGLGGALVTGALAAANREIGWIVADDEGRPKRLYERLGFTTVWIQHTFIRHPEGQPPA